jgi:ferredoxin
MLRAASRRTVGAIISSARRSAAPTTTATVRWHGGPSTTADAARIHVTFIQPDDTKKTVEAIVGESLLQTAHRNDIDLEGACEGVCACSTCHLILPSMEFYDSLEEASEDEEDMLDMAFGLRETSRLGCQIVVREDMDGVELEMPKATRNFYVDGHVPQPH